VGHHQPHGERRSNKKRTLALSKKREEVEKGWEGWSVNTTTDKNRTFLSRKFSYRGIKDATKKKHEKKDEVKRDHQKKKRKGGGKKEKEGERGPGTCAILLRGEGGDNCDWDGVLANEGPIDPASLLDINLKKS